MEILFFSTVLILIATIVYLTWHIMKIRKKVSGEEESDILTLLTEFKHVADMKISALEDKSDKLKFQLKRANETIARLTSAITDAEKVIDVIKAIYEDDLKDFNNEVVSNKLDKVETVKNTEPYASPQDHVEQNNNETTNNNQSFTDKVLKLYNEGWSIDDIARMLDKGKGEIALLLNFNNLKKGGFNES